MYPEELTKPMIKELTDFGFKEIKTIEDAEKSIKNDSEISCNNLIKFPAIRFRNLIPSINSYEFKGQMWVIRWDLYVGIS